MALDKILVLTDFTEAASVTLEHAYLLAAQNNAKLEVAHMVSERVDQYSAIAKIQEQCSSLSNYDLHISMQPIAFVGNKYLDIASFLNDANPKLVLMPTHGKKDVQLILGSFAMKIIAGTGMPFLVCQKDAPTAAFKNILVPVFAHEAISTESTQALIDLAKVFDSSIRVISPTYDTDDLLRATEAAGISISKRLKEANIQFSLHKSMTNYAKYKEVIMLEAHRHEANLIVLLSGRDAKNARVIQPKGLHQAMITNKLHVPVLCL